MTIHYSVSIWNRKTKCWQGIHDGIYLDYVVMVGDIISFTGSAGAWMREILGSVHFEVKGRIIERSDNESSIELFAKSVKNPYVVMANLCR